ncbi:unnamed protein product, partial [marine sediment metagenome]
ESHHPILVGLELIDTGIQPPSPRELAWQRTLDKIAHAWRPYAVQFAMVRNVLRDLVPYKLRARDVTGEILRSAGLGVDEIGQMFPAQEEYDAIFEPGWATAPIRTALAPGVMQIEGQDWVEVDPAYLDAGRVDV